MGSLFGSGPTIPTPPPPPPAANPPILANPAVMGQRQKSAQQNGMGFADTIKNSGGAQGVLDEGNTAKRSLLG